MHSKKIKICHVTTVDITARFIILDLLKYLQKEQYDVSIVCSPGKWTPLFQQEGFLVYNIKMLRKISPFADIMPFIKLFFFFKREKFDIVHTHTPKAGLLGRLAARLAGVPVVVHSSHGFYTGVKIDPKVKKTILFAEKVAAHFCDLVTSQNKEDVDFAIKEKLINPQKIVFLHYGIDIDRFNSLRFDQNFIYQKKEELGIGKDKKVIGMVGRFVEEKGYRDLFDAFTIVKKTHPDAVLLLVAPPDKEKDDALDYSIFKEYGIEKDIILLGREGEISNIEEIYSLMNLFVLPSYREGFPFSIMEASSCSLPVVTTDIRGCREAVENGVTGMLVPFGNHEKLAEALMYLLDHPDLAIKMGNKGREKAEREFDNRLVCKKINQLYQTYLQRTIT